MSIREDTTTSCSTLRTARARKQAAMLPLLPIINRYRIRRAIEFALVRPRDDLVDRAFTDGNWAHIIDPERHGGDTDFEDVIPALQFETEDEAMAIPDRILEIVMRNTAVGPRMLRLLDWSLYEILDNVLNHSNSGEGGFVQVMPLSEHVEFVVADAGMGIARSLGISDGVDALEQATRQGVTRDRRSNQGNGLYGSLQVAAISNGEFEIASGDATLRYPSDDTGVSLFSYDLIYPGTAVRARVGLAESGVLHRTLKFGGIEHDPVYGYVERHFETDQGEFVFSVKDSAARDVRTRRGGQRVRQQLENLLQGAETITVDFAGVEVISSSFADEVFGRLFVSLGPRAFYEARHSDKRERGYRRPDRSGNRSALANVGWRLSQGKHPNHLGDRLRCLEVGDVGGACELDLLGAGDGTAPDVAHRFGDDLVVLAGGDQRARVDSGETAADAGVGDGPEELSAGAQIEQLSDVGVKRVAVGHEQGGALIGIAEQDCGGEPRVLGEHVLARMLFRPETERIDQRERLHRIGANRCDFGGDPGADAHTDQVGGTDADGVEQHRR